MKSMDVKQHKSNVIKKPYKQPVLYRIEIENGNISKKCFDKITGTDLRIRKLKNIIEKFERIKEKHKKKTTTTEDISPHYPDAA